MKRYKRVLVLLGVLVIVVAAAFAVSHMRERKEAIKTSGETFLTVPADSVTALDWTNGDTSLAFHKEDNWLWDDDEAFPVDQEEIAKLLAPFESMAAAFVIDDVTDYEQYGLTEPECTVNLTAGETKTTVKLGAYSSLDQQRYVDIGDGKVYLVADDPLDDYDVELADLIEHDKIPALDPASFTVTGAVELDAAYTEEGDSYCAEDVYFTTDGLPLDTDRVEDWLDRFESLALTDYVTYNVTDEELAAYGLDEPDLTVTVTPKEGDPVTFELSEVIPEDAESEEETKAYIRFNGSQIIYSIAPGDYTVISQAAYDDLRHRELFTPEFESVTAIDVTLEGAAYPFVLTENEEGDSVWTYSGAEIEISGVRSALTALTASSFTDQEPTGQEEISLTLHLADEAHPELTVTLYRLDGSLCSASVNGQPVCTVSRSLAVDLIEAVNALVLG